jgi:hypothetical protein
VVDGETVLAEAAASYRNALGERLIAAYALGSLAHGGFSPLVSDIDLGLVVSDPARQEDAETIQAKGEDAAKPETGSASRLRLGAGPRGATRRQGHLRLDVGDRSSARPANRRESRAIGGDRCDFQH